MLTAPLSRYVAVLLSVFMVFLTSSSFNELSDSHSKSYSQYSAEVFDTSAPSGSSGEGESEDTSEFEKDFEEALISSYQERLIVAGESKIDIRQLYHWKSPFLEQELRPPRS